MKTSLELLPEDKQDELAIITETIMEKVQPEMIILFGSYARGNWQDDSYVENGTTYQYKSDYDILVVTDKAQEVPPGLSKKIRYKIRKAEWLQTPITIIYHDINFLNNELEDGHYFFAEIVQEGIMLYDSGKYQLATPRELSPAQRKHKAQLYYNEWFKSASRFYEDYESNFIKGQKDSDYYKNAIFNLHQAAERYFMTIALVFTDYKPKTHDLVMLYQKAGAADTRFKRVFPNQTDEDKRRFELLAKAYIDSRYKLGYTVNPEDLQWLAERVQLLKGLTEEICGEKIEGLGR